MIFASRWLQLPLYLGLILAQAVYVFHFWVELVHLIEAAMGDAGALQKLVSSLGYKGTPILDAAGRTVGYEPIKQLGETIIMLVVLGLIDVVMISNLLIMVIVGGYETFVSRLRLEGHPDQPEWLSHVNASVLKVKLATAIIGISSIHLLKTFINAANYEGQGADLADADPHRIPLLGAGHRTGGPAHERARRWSPLTRRPPASGGHLRLKPTRAAASGSSMSRVSAPGVTGCTVKPRSLGQLQHAGVLDQYGADQAARAVIVEGADELAHQQLAQPSTLELGAHDHPKLGILVVRVDDCPRNTQRLLATIMARRNGDEGDLAGVSICVRRASSLRSMVRRL
jgi:uncharacterized membrane protein YqhA